MILVADDGLAAIEGVTHMGHAVEGVGVVPGRDLAVQRLVLFARASPGSATIRCGDPCSVSRRSIIAAAFRQAGRHAGTSH